MHQTTLTKYTLQKPNNKYVQVKNAFDRILKADTLAY